ncbi:MAG: hypothetical protein FRX49_02183 [Trebouxia sp. A1-2]|nr:MAG: hypothetical protein FRX49_02183 [Trebouxia sp. A1-2]
MSGETSFVFGLVADIQYACKGIGHTEGRAQRYEEVPQKLMQAVQIWHRDAPKLEFVLSLGDIIDGRSTQAETDEDFSYIKNILGPVASTSKFLHVLGNHCLTVPRERLIDELRMPGSYYSRELPSRWRLIDSKLAQEAAHFKAQHPMSDEEPQMADWNGGIGSAQSGWLNEQLALAKLLGERVIVACHHQIGQGAARKTHMAWNWVELQQLLVASPCVRLVLSGHDHMGGYAQHGHVHFVTVEAMLEAPAHTDAYAIVEVTQECVHIKGEGSVTSRQLRV